jgi:RecB family exonuclease
MALTLDRQPCGFYDKNRWVRGIADLLIINGEDAAVIDYKTGSEKYPDPTS